MNTMDKNLGFEEYHYENNNVLLRMMYSYRKDTNKVYEVTKIFWVMNHLSFSPEFIDITDVLGVIDIKGDFIEKVTEMINEELYYNKKTEKC